MVKEVKHLTNIRLTKGDDGIFLHFEPQTGGLTAGVLLSELLTRGGIANSAIVVWAEEQLNKEEKGYKIQEKPDKTAKLCSGATVTPLITLKDESGGISHIIMDDHCYVLINGSKHRCFNTVKHWYKEAVVALSKLIERTEK